MRTFWPGIAVGAAMLVEGCTVLEVATFKSSEYSFKRKGETIGLQVLGPTDTATSGASKVELPADVAAVCRPPPVSTPGAKPAFFPAALIVALAGVVIDAGIQKIDAWTDKKIKEFTDSYTAKLNVAEFSLPTGDPPARTRCIVLHREVDLNETDDKSKKDMESALTLVLQFHALGKTAYVLKPIYLDIAYAGARTSQDGKSINLDFTVGIAVVKSGKSAAVRELVALQSFSLKKLEIRGDRAEYRMKFQEGIAIPAFDGVTAASIVVSVTEIGDGADTYSGFRKDTDTYGAVLKSFGIDQLKGALGVK